jgi:hypothetical protein
MLDKIRANLTYANVMVTVLLFIVLGGGAYAAFHLPRNSVRSKNIVNGQVKQRDLAQPQNVKGAGLVDTTPNGGCSNNNDDENWRTTDPVQPYRVGYYRDPFGRVHLQGTFENCGSSGASVLFTLPKGYRPSNTLWETAGNTGGGGLTGVGISSDGGVTPLDVLHGQTATVDGISFRCSPSGHNGCP